MFDSEGSDDWKIRAAQLYDDVIKRHRFIIRERAMRGADKHHPDVDSLTYDFHRAWITCEL